MENELLSAERMVDRVENWALGISGNGDRNRATQELTDDLSLWRSKLTYRCFDGSEIPGPCSGCSVDY